MRLGAYLAVEAVVGIAILGGLAAGTWLGIDAVQAHAIEPRLEPAPAPAPAPASTTVALSRTIVPVPEPTAVPIQDAAPTPTPDVAPTPAWTTVFPASDDELLAPLRDGAVVATKLNHGGSSLSLRLDFDNGARAAFKPEQTFPQSRPRRELAAYRIDRFLHIGRVPPVIGRTFKVDDVVAGFAPDVRRFGTRRVKTEGIPRGDVLAGSVSWWIPELEFARIDGYDVDGDDGVVTWRRLVKIGADIPPHNRWLAEQLSLVALFDFVIDNIDRWTGGNIRIAPGGHDLFFMDNTMSFTPDKLGHRKGQLYLHRIQVFSRDVVARLRAMTEDDLRKIMSDDLGPFEELLSDREIKAVLARRDNAIAYIDRLISRHGEDAVLAFP